VFLTVTNRNDAPKVEAAQVFYAFENAAVSTELGTVKATDEDGTTTFAWSITAGNSDGIFAIGSSTGVLTVAKTGVMD